MPRNLPPLNALRAFEAAARYLSFTRAGEELNVTQGAVSRQVKALEEFLEVKLFRRMNRALLLTEEGQVYLPAVREALDRIDAATTRIRGRRGQGLLTVRLLPTFAMRWLIPRLHRFQDAYPGVEVRITTSLRPIDFDREDVDMAIGREQERSPGLRYDRLMPEDLIAVCSRTLLAGPTPLRAPADLARHTLLHAASRREAWRVWVNVVGLEGVDPEGGLVFEHYYFVLQAAVDGLGVAVAPRPLVADDLDAGRLVAPFDVTVSSEDAYYLVYPESRAALPNVRAFRQWILEEAAELKAPPRAAAPRAAQGPIRWSGSANGR